MDFVITGSASAPASFPVSIDGGAEASPSVAELFAGMLDRLTGDLMATDAVAPEAGSSVERRVDSHGADESTGDLAEDEATDSTDENVSVGADLCQVSWQPIGVLPQPVVDQAVAPSPDVAANAMVDALRQVPADSDLPIADANVTELPVADVLPQAKAEKLDAAANATASDEKMPLEGAISRDEASPARTEVKGPPSVPPAAARSLARALEALNVTQPADVTKESAASPVARESAAEGSVVEAADAAVVPPPRAASFAHARQHQGESSAERALWLSRVPREESRADGNSRARGEPSAKPDTVQILPTQGSDFAPTLLRPVPDWLQTGLRQGSDPGLTPPQPVVVTRVAPHDTMEVATQIVKAMRTQVREGVSEAQIRLKPEHLGEVRIELKIDGDRVTATMQVERPEVKQAIEAQSHTLRTSLAEQGLKLDELEIKQSARTRDDRTGDDDRKGQQHQQQPDRRSKRRQPDREFDLANDE